MKINHKKIASMPWEGITGSMTLIWVFFLIFRMLIGDELVPSEKLIYGFNISFCATFYILFKLNNWYWDRKIAQENKKYGISNK